ncbi:MAG: DNA methyltransferase [Thermodesulfobium sp.]
MKNIKQKTLMNDENYILPKKPARKINRIKKLKDYEVDMGDRGIYNTKNKLNDLTGREWTYFISSVMETDFAKDEDTYALWKYLQESVIETKYPTTGPESISHNLRKLHPSPKPPQLMRDIIRFFTKPNQIVLDPFMGVGATLLGASLLGDRSAVGIDIEKKYIDIYKEVSKENSLKEQIAILNDARNILKIDEIKDRIFDFILTDPPYSDMLARKRTGGDRKDKGTFTEDPRDLGNIDYQSFLTELRVILNDAIKLLKNKGYIAIFCKDVQPTKNYHNLLHADIVESITKIPHVYFKGYKIWFDKTINLYPYGYPFSYVSHQLHQFILIFRKEED